MRSLTTAGGSGTGTSQPSSSHAGAGAVASLEGHVTGRGFTRGQRDKTRIILQTKPESLDNKRGKSGNPIALLTNYFAIPKYGDMHLYQFR